MLTPWEVSLHQLTCPRRRPLSGSNWIRTKTRARCWNWNRYQRGATGFVFYYRLL